MTRTETVSVSPSKPKVLRFAQVGAFKHASDRDVARSVTSFGAIAAIDRPFLKEREVANDVVNLSDGRDFLTEKRRYDVVIVHSVLSPNVKMFARFPRLRVSPLHSTRNWQKRLVATKAKYIAICETDPATLSGKELGDLPGYDRVEHGPFLTLYRRKG